MKFLYLLTTPIIQGHWMTDLIFALLRFVCGALLALDFGASKFGMPWTDVSQNLNLFEVAAWFPEDVAAYGGIFALFPVFLPGWELLVKLLEDFNSPWDCKLV